MLNQMLNQMIDLFKRGKLSAKFKGFIEDRIFETWNFQKWLFLFLNNL
jgi:hypothetical protein